MQFEHGEEPRDDGFNTQEAVGFVDEVESADQDEQVSSVTAWGHAAPRGGRTVLGRMLKEGATVPLFLGQTLINSLRDLGYNSTTSALCEHVDNAVQWGASEVRIYFNQSGKRGEYEISCLVYDNGKGMSPAVLKAATSFGGSMVFENRDGIGRYGMGMKTAALSVSPVFEIYSWQEPAAFYNMTIDIRDIGNSRSNLIELPDPTFHNALPSEIADIFMKYMVSPKNPHETQSLFASDVDGLKSQLGSSGTIVYMPECDRLTSKTAQTLVEHATKEMARIYRRFIDKGLRLYINNRLVDAFDPTYWMSTARHTQTEGLTPNQSQLIGTYPIEIPLYEGAKESTTATARLFQLPYDKWSDLGRTTLKNLQIFEEHTVSFIRNDREVEIGSSYPKLKIKKHGELVWVRLEIDFPGIADEGFGVAANKQGVRLKQYVADRILKAIGQELASVRENVKRLQKERSVIRSGSKPSEAERLATDAETFQGKPLPVPTLEESQSLDQNLRTLATVIRRDGETEDEAFERLKASAYVTVFKHDKYWPFYDCDFKFGRVILTINTAHPFYEKIWQPLSDLGASVSTTSDQLDTEAESLSADIRKAADDSLVGLQFLLLSLARTQSQLSHHDSESEFSLLFEKLRVEWSSNLATQLAVR